MAFGKGFVVVVVGCWQQKGGGGRGRLIWLDLPKGHPFGVAADAPIPIPIVGCGWSFF
jgi:hypothetical protein